MTNDVVRAVTTGPAIAAAALGARTPGGLYWAPFGRIDRNTANVLASAGVTTIVLSAEALPATDPSASGAGEATTSLPTSFGTIRAVLADPALSSLLTPARGSTSDVLTARQQFLAETALVATTLPEDQAERTVVVAPPPASLGSGLLTRRPTSASDPRGTLAAIGILGADPREPCVDDEPRARRLRTEGP